MWAEPRRQGSERQPELEPNFGGWMGNGVGAPAGGNDGHRREREGQRPRRTARWHLSETGSERPDCPVGK